MNDCSDWLANVMPGKQGISMLFYAYLSVAWNSLTLVSICVHVLLH